MTARSILNIFEEYRKARVIFVQTVADLALRPQNIDMLKSNNVIELLRPLLNDVCVQIQQCAAVAFGRMAHHDPVIGNEMLRGDLLDLLLKDIEKRNKHYKKSAMFVLRSVCKHDAEVAESIINSGGLEALIICLEDHDLEVKEAATWACGYVARHKHSLARSMVDAGAVPHLVLCLQEPELAVRRVAASALADIARHGTDLAQHVIDSGGVAYIARALNTNDDRLKRQALMALSAIARHTETQAESVLQADILPQVLIAMGHACALVRRNAAMLIRDITRHGLDLAQLIANTGGIGALVHAMSDEAVEVRVPAATALGFISGHGAQLASCVVTCGGLKALTDVLLEEGAESEMGKQETLCVTVWAIGQLARHTPEAVATEPGVLSRLLYLLQQFTIGNEDEETKERRSSMSLKGQRASTGAISPGSLGQAGGVSFGTALCEFSDSVEFAAELRSRCKGALRLAVAGCTTLQALEPLLHGDCPNDILKHVLAQFAKILPRDPRARRLFVTTGALRRVQELEAEPGSTMMEYITLINSCFPDEIVRYYTPGYPDTLLERVEQFVPNLELLDDDNFSPSPRPSETNSQELLP